MGSQDFSKNSNNWGIFFRITDGYLQGFVNEKLREMKITSNKREIRISAGSNNRDSTVPH